MVLPKLGHHWGKYYLRSMVLKEERSVVQKRKEKGCWPFYQEQRILQSAFHVIDTLTEKKKLWQPKKSEFIKDKDEIGRQTSETTQLQFFMSAHIDRASHNDRCFLGSFQTHVPLMKLGGSFSFLLFGIVLFLFAFNFIFMETDFLLLFIYLFC